MLICLRAFTPDAGGTCSCGTCCRLKFSNTVAIGAADHLTTRIFHYEDKRYCSRTCFNLGTVTQIGGPLFEAKPFPPGMTFLKARAR